MNESAPDLPGSTPPSTTPEVNALPIAPPAPAVGAPPVAEALAPPAAEAPAPSATPKPSRGLALPIALTLVAGTVLGGTAGAVTTGFVLSQQQQSVSGAVSQPASITINDSDEVTAATAVAAKAAPAIVTISAISTDGGAVGSGVVIDNDGHILTNAHVATLEGATDSATLEVTDSTGRIQSATLVGYDPVVDLAVIKVTETEGLEPIEFGDSREVQVGDGAIVFGAALGLPNSVSDGIISNANRGITIASSEVADTTDSESGSDGTDEQGTDSNIFDFWGFNTPNSGTSTASTGLISVPVFQTDAAINQGNSGGALLDTQGRLIGIVVALANGSSSSGNTGSAGVGFAIPSAVAERVAKEIIATGTATHGLLGALVSDATAEDGFAGARVEELVEGGAAERAGLRVGDVLTSVDGVAVGDATDLTAWIRAQAGGATVPIGFVRDGERDSIDVTLGTLE